MIFNYFTFHKVSDSVKFSTAVFFSLVLVSGTKYDLLPFKSVPDVIRFSRPYFFIKCFASVILLRILSQTELPFRAIDDLGSSVRNGFTRNEPEYDGFTLTVLGYADNNRVSKRDLRHYFGLSGSREVQQKPSRTFTIQNLMKQISYQQIPACFLYKVQSEYFLLYAFRLMRFLKFYFNSLPCHPDCLTLLNLPADYQYQDDQVQRGASWKKSPFQLLFSRLQHGLSATKHQYERSELGEPALDRDLALLRYFLSRTLGFHRLVGSISRFQFTNVGLRSRRDASWFYSKVCEVSLDLGAYRSAPWLSRVLETLFNWTGYNIGFSIAYIYREDNTEHVIYRDLRSIKCQQID